MHESFAIFNVLMWWRCDGKFGVWGGSFLELNTAKTENSRFAVQGKVFRSEQCSWQTQAWKVGVFRQRCYHALVQTHFRKRCRLRILYAVRNGDVSLGFSPWYCGACASPLHLGGTVCTSRRSTWQSKICSARFQFPRDLFCRKHEGRLSAFCLRTSLLKKAVSGLTWVQSCYSK